MIQPTFSLVLPNLPNAVTVEHCKPILIPRILRDPQCWHYDRTTRELILVRTRKGQGGK